MVLFKQNRCIALLVGVILVCFSAISLMNPEGAAKGENVIEMQKMQSASHTGEAAPIPDAAPSSYRISSTMHTIKPMLYTTAAEPVHTWTRMVSAGWLSPEKLQRQGAAKTGIVQAQAKAVVVKASPPVAQALKKAATGNTSVNKGTTATQLHPPATLFFSRTKLLSQEQQAEATWSYAVTEEDLLLLQKIVMAEAEGEPYQGKVAVANVVLNRLRSANFPDTIHDVIYQKSQFSPVANGRLGRVKPNADSIKAVNAALMGVKEVTDDTYFFLSLKLAQDLTVHHSRTLAKTIGNHTFYK
jgi:N-acetylmuramoyl-L-alanine amidase